MRTMHRIGTRLTLIMYHAYTYVRTQTGDVRADLAAKGLVNERRRAVAHNRGLFDVELLEEQVPSLVRILLRPARTPHVPTRDRCEQLLRIHSVGRGAIAVQLCEEAAEGRRELTFRGRRRRVQEALAHAGCRCEAL